MYDAFNAKDLDRCVSYAHADAEMTNMPFGATLTLREYLESWARAFPDGKIEMKSVVVQGDRAMAEFTGRGTHTGTLKGPTGDLSATQRRLELACVESYRFRDGKLAEGRIYFDAFSMFTQLGIGAPAQGRAATATPSAR
jgi:predicted ester cyclase